MLSRRLPHPATSALGLPPEPNSAQARTAAAVGDAPSSDRTLREALDLYRTIGATGHAARLDRNVSSHTPDSLSVYGSLLLRGAIAAAQQDKRQTAHELVNEADVAARQLGVDGNLRWTAFGPTNATLHRVSVSVTLGDAGTAVQVARGIDLSAITVTERKANLLIDTARAFLQWGRHEKAYLALRSAEEVAHEEVAGRPAVHLLVRQLMTTAPPSIRRAAELFAARIGVSR